ncbi:MAG: hypothetical protein QOH91_675 [Mycobacterium sp.]|nr:hypothetical protein [Mycobacterium sp.]
MPDPAVRRLVDLVVYTKEGEKCLLGQGCHPISLAESRRLALGLAGAAFAAVEYTGVPAWSGAPAGLLDELNTGGQAELGVDVGEVGLHGAR